MAILKQSNKNVLLLSIIGLFGQFSIAQDSLIVVEKYSVMHFRIGTNSFREVGFNTNLFIRKIPEMTLGLGYRYKSTSDLTLGECFSFYPFGRLTNINSSGPFLTLGYEMKNEIGRRQAVNPFFQVQLRRLKAKDLSFSEGECENSEVPQGDTEYFDLKATDVNLKAILDIGGNESAADFYIGIGLGARYAKKLITKIGNMKVDKTDRVKIPLISFYMGLRLSFMDSIEPKSPPSSGISN